MQMARSGWSSEVLSERVTPPGPSAGEKQVHTGPSAAAGLGCDRRTRTAHWTLETIGTASLAWWQGLAARPCPCAGGTARKGRLSRSKTLPLLLSPRLAATGC